jgi:hypothetical protein
MRPARRKPSRRRGSAAATGGAISNGRPVRPRRAAARRLSLHNTMADLRRGREAVSAIAGQLEQLLAQLDEPGQIDAAAPDRLATAARQADRAFAALTDLRRLLP